MDSSRKKGKRASAGQSSGVGNGGKGKANYQKLLNKYLNLQKECVSKRRKLRTWLMKKETTLNEVRFLRRRRESLLRNRAPIIVTAEQNQLQVEGNFASAAPQDPVWGVKLVAEAVENAVKPGKKSKNRNALNKQKKCWSDQVTLKV